MVRAPCCEKMGLKKGPWTPEEDQILVSYIQRYGHGNWRALPKQAGLLRCGKSCRLRWINYLRPDIKRGNFTREEEETIIKLHELLGNRWSAIAARLPGRTDNEIKNVWHTHLKKRLQQNSTPSDIRRNSAQAPHYTAYSELNPVNFPNQYMQADILKSNPVSPQQSSSDTSVVTSEIHNYAIKDETSTEFNKTCWPDSISLEDPSTTTADDCHASVSTPQIQLPFSTFPAVGEPLDQCGPTDIEGLDYWFNLLVESGALLELPEI